MCTACYYAYKINLETIKVRCISCCKNNCSISMCGNHSSRPILETGSIPHACICMYQMRPLWLVINIHVLPDTAWCISIYIANCLQFNLIQIIICIESKWGHQNIYNCKGRLCYSADPQMIKGVQQSWKHRLPKTVTILQPAWPGCNGMLYWGNMYDK